MANMNNSPIGVFDSGMGGLSVWRELRRTMPEESLVYMADGKNCPYGNRPPEELREYVFAATEELLRRDIKLLVVACNTATAVAIASLREHYKIPIVGMEPAVKPAALSSHTGVIGILATRASLDGDLFRNTCAHYDSRIKILSAVGEGFVEAVENGREHTPETLELVRRAVEPLIEGGADKIVLGCTHYPFLKEAVRQVIGDRKVDIVDPAPAIVRRTAWLLDSNSLRAECGHKADYSFVTFAGDDYLEKITCRALRLAQE